MVKSSLARSVLTGVAVLVVISILWSVTPVSGDKIPLEADTAALRESIRSQVVEFEPAFSDPETLLGKNTQGWTVWVKRPKGNRYLRHDAQGRVIETLDDRGNRELYRESNLPRKREVLFLRPAVGRWRQISINDADDWRVLEIVNPDSPSFGSLAARLGQMGLAEGVVPPAGRITQQETEGWVHHSNTNSYATIESFWGPRSWLTPEQREAFRNGQEAPESELVWREVSTILGQKMTVERFRERDRYVVTDDWGGWRAEIFGPSGLTSISDRAGRVLWITRDVHGRLCEIILGERRCCATATRTT